MRILKVSLLVALLVLLQVSSVGQEVRINPRLPNPRIRERYDRFSDLTSVLLLIGLINDGQRTLELAVSGVVEGQDTSKSSPRVVLIVTSSAAEWQYLKPPVLLQVIVDDKVRATLGEFKRITSEVRPRGRGVIEQLQLEVPAKVILKLAKAKKLEMRIGADEVEISERQLLDLDDWLYKFPAIKADTAETSCNE